MSGQFMTIDNVPVEIRDEKNILELVRRAGIELPTFCFYSELSVYGACRMCMVETKRGDMESACSTPPRAGMEIYTNTPRLRRYRKNILELLLANHCRDCTTCQQSGACKLQELAKRFGINDVRFPNTAKCNEIDDSSVAIVRNKSKCILCGDCVRVCEEVQNVGAIDFVGRGSKMTVTTAFDEPIGNSNCVSCGQCAAVCPTGAIVVRSKTEKLWEELNDPNTKVVVQIAPAVRVGISSKLEEDGRYAMGKMVAALRRMGFDFVFDTSVGADLTVIEETNEFVSKLQKNQDLPLFTSCCPAWVKYAENTYPELMKNVSTCKSPMEMFAAVLKEHYKEDGKRLVSVAIMPCSAKKFEADREEFKRDGAPDVDYVVTTQELINMINESGIAFSELEPEALDRPFQSSSGAGVIFGVTGGVTEAVLRKVLSDTPVPALRALAFEGVRGMDGVKEATITALDREIKIAIVSGLKNADNIIKKIKAGEAHYDFIEVMACPGGCIAGAGQPFAKADEKYNRSVRLYKVDKMKSISRSDDNPLMDSLYSGVLKGRAHELLHVHYNNNK
jgi:NADH-quinone oxidoreductase subunit G